MGLWLADYNFQLSTGDERSCARWQSAARLKGRSSSSGPTAKTHSCDVRGLMYFHRAFAVRSPAA
jgi:hypothetical protein